MGKDFYPSPGLIMETACEIVGKQRESWSQTDSAADRPRDFGASVPCFGQFPPLKVGETLVDLRAPQGEV